MENKYLSHGFKFFEDKKYRFYVMQSLGIFNSMSDEEYLRKAYRVKMDRSLNLEVPKAYSEKLQWLKLYDRRPEYIKMVDKYEVKEYVAGIIGDEYVIPLLGVWDDAEKIDFDTLPNQFVLKCTHNSGGIIVCKDKKTFNCDITSKKLCKQLKKNYYLRGREWPYKHVQPRIIAEYYMEDEATHELRDYKFFTFNGKAKAMFIATGRMGAGEPRFDFFDMDFNHLPFTNGHPNADVLPEKPHNFELMKELSEQLSEGIPHLRVDFYEVNGKVYFGEFTFYHYSGMRPFKPSDWDEKLGDWLELPEKHTNPVRRSY